MKKLIKYIFFIAIPFFFFACGDSEYKTEDTTNFDKLDWMLGIWQGKQGDADLYESWRKKNFRIMEGVSFTTKKGKRLFGQSMRLEQSNNKIFLILKTEEDDEGLTLPLDNVTEDKAVFLNENETGYPQKVIYEKSGKNSMTVTLEGENEESTTELSYNKTSEV